MKHISIIIKVFVYILIALIVVIMFFAPVRNYMNNLLRHNKQEEVEDQIIGRVSGYNEHVKEIQESLKEAGFDPGSVDGVLGEKTRMAIKGFQKKEGLKSTGKIDSATQLALNRVKEIKKPSSGAKLKFASLNITAPEDKKQIQIALQNAGYYKGKIDGKIGSRTKAAIIAFQKAKQLNPDGVVDAKTWEELKRYLKN